MLFALTTANRTALIAAGVLIAWLFISAAVAEYGRARGYPWFPLFIASVFLGFPLVLLGVTLATGPVLPTVARPRGRANGP